MSNTESELEISAAPRARARVLTWLKGSDYHTVTECKRFAVARVSVLGRVRYEAYLTPKNAPAIQIASRQLGPTPTREERDEAIDALKAECEAVPR